MPPVPPDSSVGRTSGPVGAARRIRTPHRPRHTECVERVEHVEHPGRTEQTGPSANSRTSSALEALLVDLGSQVHRGVSQEAAEILRFCPTGLEELDAGLGGGFPIGRLSEICGAPSSGRTSLALSLLSETLNRGVLAAWVDLADAFDPISATLAGSDLENLLWVRARSSDEALQSCERLLQTEGFELVILDLATTLPTKPSRTRSRSQRGEMTIRVANWLRLARLASSTRSALVVISNASVTGSQAELILEMKPLAAHFVGPPKLLEALETTAVLQRHRSRPTGQEVLLRVQADDPPPTLEPTPEPNPRRLG
jgi:hypothetical protein